MSATNDRSSLSVSTRVVEAVAAETETSIHELDPLYHSIDPDSLESLIESTGDDQNQTVTHVSFRYAGHLVTVSHDGSIDLSPVGADERSPQNVSAQLPSRDSKGTK